VIEVCDAVRRGHAEANVVVVTAVMSQPEIVLVKVVQDEAVWPLRPGALAL
jgi:hypothetical protein